MFAKDDKVRVMNAMDSADCYETAVVERDGDIVLIRIPGLNAIIAFDAQSGVSRTGTHYIERVS